jgi:hypothetical protein
MNNPWACVNVDDVVDDEQPLAPNVKTRLEADRTTDNVPE